MRGAFGETNFDTKTIRINKNIHEKAKKKSIYGIPKKDSTLLNTIVHELLHKAHPDMHEKNIRKLARTRIARMNEGQKRTLYSKFA